MSSTESLILKWEQYNEMKKYWILDPYFIGLVRVKSVILHDESKELKWEISNNRLHLLDETIRPNKSDLITLHFEFTKKNTKTPISSNIIVAIISGIVTLGVTLISIQPRATSDDEKDQNTASLKEIRSNKDIKEASSYIFTHKNAFVENKDLRLEYDFITSNPLNATCLIKTMSVNRV